MDMEVVGRHALLFDDDAMAAFVNTRDALVEWNSLLIDRYDVRHLLNAPPPPVKRRRHQSENDEESLLDQDRYLDLPQPSDDSADQENIGAEPTGGSSYRTVAFSYGNADASSDPKSSDVSSFLPPFSVPQTLLQSLPPNEKLHQIMARTAIFVSQHGGQSEIVLRVKQGNNPMFGFLMPDHHLHEYFRFLVDHPELLKSDSDVKLQNKDGIADQVHNNTNGASGEALSLLGSVYGEDDDGPPQMVSEPKENEPLNAVSDAIGASLDNGLEREASLGLASGDNVIAPKPLSATKEKASLARKIRPVNAATSSTATLKKKRESDVGASLSSSGDKSHSSALQNASKSESLIVEPSSDLKRMVDKIIEFILKNGKGFEAALIEQDIKSGKFPFLLPSNLYHPYYKKALEKAQALKQAGKNLGAQKTESIGNGKGKTYASSKKTDTLSGGSPNNDFYDPERKEKFKMVIGGFKKDTDEPPPKPVQRQCGVSVDAVEAILQAATRGLRNPKLDSLPKASLCNSSLGLSSDGGPTSSIGNISFPSRVDGSISRPTSKGDFNMPGKEGSGTRDVSVAKAIAKTAALAAASEADSSEASLTKEQKQKAERLKRAKMFAAMIKSGAAPRVNGPLPRSSAEPPDPTIGPLAGSGCKDETQEDSMQVHDASNLSGGTIVDILDREREGSSVPVDVTSSDRLHKPEKSDNDDVYKERRSRMKKHLRSRRVEEEDEEEEEEEEEEKKRDDKRSRNKHRSHHSSQHSRDERRHRKRHSSSKDRESRHRHKYDSSSEDDHRYQSRSDKRRKTRTERKVESEDESSRKLSDESNTNRHVNTVSREASVDLINAPSSEPSQITQVPDDLRAKVRAMLLATL